MMIALCKRWLACIYKSFSACTPRNVENDKKACFPNALTSKNRAEFNAQGGSRDEDDDGGSPVHKTNSEEENNHGAPVSDSITLRRPLSIISRNPEYLFGGTSSHKENEDEPNFQAESKFQFKNVHDRTKVKIGPTPISLGPEEMLAEEVGEAVKNYFNDEQVSKVQPFMVLNCGDEHMSLLFLQNVLKRVKDYVRDTNQPISLKLLLVSCYMDHRFFRLLRTNLTGLTSLELRLTDDCRLNLPTQAHWEEVRKCFLSLGLTLVVVDAPDNGGSLIEYSMWFGFYNLDLRQPSAETFEGESFLENESLTEEDPALVRAQEPIPWITIERINNEWQVTNLPLVMLAAELEMTPMGSNAHCGLSTMCSLSDAFMERLVREFSIWPTRSSLGDMVSNWSLYRFPKLGVVWIVDTTYREHERDVYERDLRLIMKTVNLACIKIQVDPDNEIHISRSLNFLEELRRVVPKMLPFELIFTHTAGADLYPRIAELESQILMVLERGKSKECQSLMAMVYAKRYGSETPQASCMLKILSTEILRYLHQFVVS